MKTLTLLLLFCIGIVSPAVYAQEQDEDLSDYKTACLEAIDNIGKISDGFSVSSMITIAKSSLNACGTKDDMRRTMTALRAGVTGYLQTVSTFPDGQVYTGLLGNRSFDTGDLSTWYCVDFDLSQISLTDITNAIGSGNVSGLADAVTINNWNEGTQAVENEGADAIQGGHGKYYLNSNQLIMQPVIGLPAGIYSLSAKAACTPGLLRLNKVHLNALVISSSVAQEILGDIISDGNWKELFSNFNLIPYITPFLKSGKLYTASVSCKNLTTLSDGELRFIIDKGDIVILGINAGMVPFIGTEKYHADDLQLTGLRAADRIITPAKAGLAEALQGLNTIEANYNASLEETAVQPAFTYDRTITENYNNALRTAKDKYDNDKLSDILTKNDLNNLDGIADALDKHYDAEIKKLNSTKEAFDRHAFIPPAPTERFNIVMKDDWISLLTPKWTGNAVTTDESMALSFSQPPGQSVFTLAFSFGKASDESANQLYAYADDGHNRYCLGEKDGSVILTTDLSQAISITAIPSYTEEGNISLMAGDMYLGTSNANNTLVKTGTGSFLRPARTGLTVLPASGKEISITVPAGRNAFTLMLPFDAALPEGTQAYAITGIDNDLSCTEGEARTSLKANIPYLIMLDGLPSAEEGWSKTFSGIPQAILPSYSEGLLTGRHTPYTVRSANGYRLTADEGGYEVFRQTEGQPVAANECYLTCETPSDVIFVRQTDAATGIGDNREQATAGNTHTPCYDLCGRRISDIPGVQRKGIYIRDGRKFIR